MIEIRTFKNTYIFSHGNKPNVIVYNDFVGVRNGLYHLKCELVLKCLLIFFWNTMKKKKVFYNWPCNSIFELDQRLAHYIYMSWVLMDKLHKLQSWNSLYIRCNNCNFVKTTHFQLLCNSIITTFMMSC